MTFQSRGEKRGRWRPVALVGGIILILVLSKILGLDQRLGDLRDWIRSLGAWGPAVFVLLYITAVVAALPGAAISIAAGAGVVLAILVRHARKTLHEKEAKINV